MVAVMEQISREPFIVVPFFAGILWNIGNLLMGIAIWRSGTLWKWGATLYDLRLDRHPWILGCKGSSDRFDNSGRAGTDRSWGFSPAVRCAREVNEIRFVISSHLEFKEAG